MFEAFGATSSKASPKGANGPQPPQRSETQRAIDAQRGLDPREPRGEPRVPSAEVLRALHSQFEAELAAARGAPRADSEVSSVATEGDQPAAELDATAAAQARLFLPAAPAPRGALAEDAPGAPEGGFVLPFGWVTFLCLQLGLFAVAFGLGALTAGGSTAAAGDGSDLGLGRAAEQGDGSPAGGAKAPGELPGNKPTGTRNTQQPTRPATDPAGVRGARPVAPTADSGRPESGNGTDDPHLAAFLDPANLFTLQIASYDGSPNGQGMARHWQAYLRERQLPAVLRQVGTRLALFVGASPNLLEIEELQKRVLELRDERGTRNFAGTRVVNLKDYR
jgi:hypothetical protein